MMNLYLTTADKFPDNLLDSYLTNIMKNQKKESQPNVRDRDFDLKRPSPQLENYEKYQNIWSLNLKNIEKAR